MIINRNNSFLTKEKSLVVRFDCINVLIKFRFDNGQFIWYYDEKDKWCRGVGESDIPLLSFLDPDDKSSPVNLFLKTMPSGVIKETKRFVHMQTLLLQQVLNEPKLLDLLLSTPVLAWLLVMEGEYNKKPAYWLKDILHLKQFEIVNELYHIDSKSAITVLRKLSDQSRFTYQDYIILKNKLFREDVLDFFKTRTKINTLHIQSFCNNKDIAHYYVIFDLFKAVDKSKAFFPDEANKIRYLISKCNQLGINFPNTEREIQSCKSIKDLEKLLKRYKKRNDLIINNMSQKLLLPEFVDILQILSLKDLIQEGKILQHCVADYATQVENGKSFMFKVLYPERGTLELTLSKDNTLQINQFFLKKNQLPHRRTRKIVDQWLKYSIRYLIKRYQRHQV